MSTTIVRRSHIHKKDNTGSLLVDGSGGPDTSILPLFFDYGFQRGNKCVC